MGEGVDWQDFATQQGSGEDYPRTAIATLAKRLEDLRSEFPPVLYHRDPKGGAFEAKACGLVHATLPFDAVAMSDKRFWTWLAVAELPELVEWRHGTEERPADFKNYGIGGPVENLFFRMWLRADIAHDDKAGDPYWIAKIDDQDIWRSHILRVRYACNRSLAKQLVLYQHPSMTESTLSIDQVRELSKRLKRLQANLTYAYLDEEQIGKVIAEQARDL
jgi:hypothetical protein